MLPPRFWMIHGHGRGAPTVQHNSFEKALDEAKRLARNDPGTRFFVLESVAIAVKPDVDVLLFSKRQQPTPINTDDEIPF